MALRYPEKVGIYAEPQGDRIKLNSTPKIILEGLDAIGFRWYYTTASAADYDIANGFDNSGTLTDPGYTPTYIVQYPSIFDPFPRYQNTTTLNQAQAMNRLLLPYNEPWNGFNNYWAGHPYTPTQALDGWPALMALGNRLASPSISYSTFAASNAWLAEFMAGVASRGYRVDAINAHFYAGTETITDFRNYLAGVHATYPSLPIVVGEWSKAVFDNINSPYTPLDQADFAEAGCLMMDSLDYVERHGWFCASEGNGFFWQNSAVINADGSRTAVGDRFVSILGTAVTPPPPPPPDTGQPTMSGYMKAKGLLSNPDQGTVIAAMTGALPTYSSILNTRNIKRRTV
jgi:hypothetical protein